MLENWAFLFEPILDLWFNQYLSNLRERHAPDKFPKIKSEIFHSPKIDKIATWSLKIGENSQLACEPRFSCSFS